MGVFGKNYCAAGGARLYLALLFPVVWGVFAPQTLLAVTCAETATDAASIQTLITAAASGEVICVPVGTYQVNLTLKEGVILHGAELARTIIERENALSPIVTGAVDSIVQNLTIRGAGADGVGISATNLTGFTVRNAIITGTTTGIDADNSSFTVSNVVLNVNSTAISADNGSILTLNNTAITFNTTDRVLATLSTETATNNLIFGNQTQNYPADDATSKYTDPLFVAPASNDFHLKTASPAKNAGTGIDPDTTTADIGAYGGENADLTPFPVSGLNISAKGLDTVTLAWSANSAYNIGGYKVYFDTDASGPPYEGTAGADTSPASVTAGTLTKQLSSLVSPVVTLTAPTDLITVPGNGTILVSWAAVPEATGYQVSYGTTSGSYTTTVNVGNSLLYQIPGLTNFVPVYIIVNAYSQPTVYLAVAAVDDAVPSHESALVSEVSTVLTESLTAGPAASEVSETPEPTVTFPDLNDENKCFIATAAYGSSLEPQVVVLRKFRNRFLLTNAPGRRFVALYYQFSPPAASFISAHGWLKAVVQAGLYPVVGLAWFCLQAGPLLLLLSGLGVLVSIMVLRVYGRTNSCV